MQMMCRSACTLEHGLMRKARNINSMNKRHGLRREGRAICYLMLLLGHLVGPSGHVSYTQTPTHANMRICRSVCVCVGSIHEHIHTWSQMFTPTTPTTPTTYTYYTYYTHYTYYTYYLLPTAYYIRPTTTTLPTKPSN